MCLISPPLSLDQVHLQNVYLSLVQWSSETVSVTEQCLPYGQEKRVSQKSESVTLSRHRALHLLQLPGRRAVYRQGQGCNVGVIIKQKRWVDLEGGREKKRWMRQQALHLKSGPVWRRLRVAWLERLLIQTNRGVWFQMLSGCFTGNRWVDLPA